MGWRDGVGESIGVRRPSSAVGCSTSVCSTSGCSTSGCSTSGCSTSGCSTSGCSKSSLRLLGREANDAYVVVAWRAAVAYQDRLSAPARLAPRASRGRLPSRGRPRNRVASRTGSDGCRCSEFPTASTRFVSAGRCFCGEMFLRGDAEALSSGPDAQNARRRQDLSASLVGRRFLASGPPTAGPVPAGGRAGPCRGPGRSLPGAGPIPAGGRADPCRGRG